MNDNEKPLSDNIPPPPADFDVRPDEDERERFGNRMGFDDFASEFSYISDFLSFIHSDIDDIDDIDDYGQVLCIYHGFQLLKPVLLEWGGTKKFRKANHVLLEWADTKMKFRKAN